MWIFKENLAMWVVALVYIPAFWGMCIHFPLFWDIRLDFFEIHSDCAVPCWCHTVKCIIKHTGFCPSLLLGRFWSKDRNNTSCAFVSSSRLWDPREKGMVSYFFSAILVLGKCWLSKCLFFSWQERKLLAHFGCLTCKAYKWPVGLREKWKEPQIHRTLPPEFPRIWATGPRGAPCLLDSDGTVLWVTNGLYCPWIPKSRQHVGNWFSSSGIFNSEKNSILYTCGRQERKSPTDGEDFWI